MFIINYRITTDEQYLRSLSKDAFNYESDLEGFFELNFNGNIYGYFHDRPLREGEEGDQLLTNWFSSLLQAYLALQKTKYVLINDIESYNTWIELKLEKDMLVVSVIKAAKPDGVHEIFTQHLENYEISDWGNVSISFSEFKNELVCKSIEYMEKVKNINTELLQSNRFLNLKLLLAEVMRNGHEI